jgi:hypothetical protein
MVLYAIALLAASYVVTRIVPGTAMGIVGNIFGEEPGKVAPVLILTFINIHHYFTDGVIWKISNPEVRKELFAHVQPANAGRPTVAPPASADLMKRKQRTSARR